MNAERFGIDYRPGNRWLRRKIDPARYLRLLQHCAVGVLVLLVLVAAAWPRLEAVRLGYRVESLRLEKEGLEKKAQRLRAELGTITDPSRLGRVAAERFGLTAPTEVVRLRLPDPSGDRPAAGPSANRPAGAGAARTRANAGPTAANAPNPNQTDHLARAEGAPTER